MSESEFVWGIVLVAAGVFISVYGNMLFRFALAVMGFGLGFLAAVWLTDGQDTVQRVLVGLAIGGIAAIAFYTLVQCTVYIAGGIFGLIVALVVSALFSLFGPNLNDVVVTMLGIAGLIAGKIAPPPLLTQFGRRLSQEGGSDVPDTWASGR